MRDWPRFLQCVSLTLIRQKNHTTLLGTHFDYSRLVSISLDRLMSIPEILEAHAVGETFA
jgi:hypothetical protein